MEDRKVRGGKRRKRAWEERGRKGIRQGERGKEVKRGTGERWKRGGRRGR
jgi:hypothetical protein